MEQTEWFDYIDDDDLNSTKSYESMILHCPECNALFGSKACGNRTIFPWFGYHPTDGNVQVIDEEMRTAVKVMAMACDCKPGPVRIRTVAKLREIIKWYQY